MMPLLPVAAVDPRPTVGVVPLLDTVLLADGALADEALVDGALADEALVDGAPVDGALAGGVLIDGALVDGALVGGTLVDGVLVDGALVDGVVVGEALADVLLVDVVLLVVARVLLSLSRPAVTIRGSHTQAKCGGTIGQPVDTLVMMPLLYQVT